MSPEVEDFSMALFCSYPDRIHCGSLLLNALKNRWSLSNVHYSILWETVRKDGEEKIQAFQPHIYHSFSNELEDYTFALAQLSKSESSDRLKSLQVPVEFHFHAMLYLLRNELLWFHYDASRSIFPFGNILSQIKRDRRWQIRTFWTMLKGFTYGHSDTNVQGCLEPIFTIVLSLIQKYDDPHLSLFQFFEPLFLKRKQVHVCLHCRLWLDNVSARQRNHWVKAEMCLICLLKRYLTFTNWSQLSTYLGSYGFPEMVLLEALAILTESKRFYNRLVDILWQHVQHNNVKGLMELADSCKIFHLEPSSLLSSAGFLGDRTSGSDETYLPQIPLLAQCSAGCFAVFMDKFHLSDEDMLQCITDLSEYQSHVEKERKMFPLVKEKPISLPYQSSILCKSGGDLYQSSYTYQENVKRFTQFPHTLIFEREMIVI
jgi:hypothetical protein